MTSLSITEEAVVPEGASAVRITDLPEHLLDEILAWLQPPGGHGKHTQVRALPHKKRQAAPAVGAPIMIRSHPSSFGGEPVGLGFLVQQACKVQSHSVLQGGSALKDLTMAFAGALECLQDECASCSA